MRKSLLLVVGILVLTAQAPADPVMTNYRAYRAALQAGDLAGAETAAHAAWDAANATDPSGARAGVLALNYAKVALANGHREPARAPAQQAAAMASTQAAGLDPVRARLVLGRTALLHGADETDVEPLLTALNDAGSRQDIASDAYDAATDLGQWAVAEQHFQIASVGYDKAAELSPFAPGDHDMARGEARTAQGVALIMAAATSEVGGWNRGLGQTGSSLRGNDEHQLYGRAQAALVQAEEALFPLAVAPTTETGLTAGQRSYALARAWRAVIGARLLSNDQAQLEDPSVRLRMLVQDDRPMCPFRVVTSPDPRYPAGAANRGQFGAVVTRFVTNPDGTTRDVRVAAAIPERFGQAVSDVAPRWHVEKAADAPANCQMQPVIFYTITFRIE